MFSLRILVLPALLILGSTLFVPAPARANAVPPTPEPRYAPEKMIDRTFSVDRGGLLDIRVADADLNIVTTDDREAHVVVWLDARDMRRGREYFEMQRFSVEKRGQTVEVLTDPPRRVNWSWERWGEINIWVDVRIPRTFNAEIQTSDGDIVLEALDGRVNLKSSDGDIETGRLTGPSISIRTSDGDILTEALSSDDLTISTSDGDIRLDDIEADEVMIRTSDGDISARNITGEMDISTSDGNLRMGNLRGPTIRLRTSDGEIDAETLAARNSDVQTSDGDITLGFVEGGLRATTASGEVRVGLSGDAAAYLRSSDGNVYLELPTDASADIDIRGEDVRLASSFRFQGDLDDENARGRLGSGGPLIEARASDGTVIVRAH